MKGAAVLKANAGDAICSLSDINCLVPRYDKRQYKTKDRTELCVLVVDMNCDSIQAFSIYMGNHMIIKSHIIKSHAVFFFHIKIIDKCILW